MATLDLLVMEYNSNDKNIVGTMHYRSSKNGYRFLCYVKTDMGNYLTNTEMELVLDNEHPLNESYKKRFSFHKGMLKLRNTDTYFLVSESAKVKSIVLGKNVNDEVDDKLFIGNTKSAYIEFYNFMTDIMKKRGVTYVHIPMSFANRPLKD